MYLIVGSMFELFLRLQHDCPYNDLSKKYPEARISQWCNGFADILEIEANGLEAYEALQHELSSASTKHSSRIISKTLCQDKFQLVARTCFCGSTGTSASPIMAKHDFMEVPPTVMMGGWEYYRR